MEMPWLSLQVGERVGFPGNEGLGSAPAPCSDRPQPPKSAPVPFPRRAAKHRQRRSSLCVKLSEE